MSEARQLYDQLAILSPLMLALSAATPIYRGYLSDIDVRWNVISASCDDRTDEEKGLAPLKESRRVIRTSRYSSIDSFLFSNDPSLNDIPLTVDEGLLKQLEEAHVDAPIARHIAHLFIRDPLVIYQSRIDLNDEVETDHFENIQSTNWQSVRFKPPPPGSGIGWRVEFRTLEVQLTDFENAAFAVFLVLLTKVITLFEIDMYLPISLVNVNMARAHARDAIHTQKFYFAHKQNSDDSSRKPTQMTLNEIINGFAGNADTPAFPGLVPLVSSYLDTRSHSAAERAQIGQYLDLISARASGKLATTATWYRNFVTSHPQYHHDSRVTPEIAYDLLSLCAEISKENKRIPGLSI